MRSRNPNLAWRPSLALLAVLGLVLAACGGAAEPEPEPEPDPEPAAAQEAAADEVEEEEPEEVDRVHIVVTTSVLGDIVSTLAQDDAEVTVIMPPGADPHGFEPSASDGRILREADLIVANGLLLEESLVSVLEAVEEEGGNVFTLADLLEPIPFEWDGPGHSHGDDDHGDAPDDDDHGHSRDDADHGHSHDDEDGHDDDGHGDEDEHGHEHGDEDPHFWFDPLRTADGVLLLAEEIAAVDTVLDAEEWMTRAEAYADELRALDAELVELFDTIPTGNRTLVTNHDALGYLAERYDLEVLGTVIPGATTQAEADPRSFAELIETVERAGVEVVFAENTDSTVLAEQLASEVVGRTDVEVEVVRIYTDALGEPGSGADTYPGLLRTTATLIVEALGGTV